MKKNAGQNKQRKKKVQHHAESILQHPEDRERCYMCMLRNDDYSEPEYLERHHVMFGAGRRKKAEADGLTVMLCRSHHYEVHHDNTSRRGLCVIAQREYEKTHTRAEWMDRYGRNYLEEEKQNEGSRSD